MKTLPKTKGLKFYKWVGDKCTVIRLYDYNEVKHEYIMLDENNRKIKIPEDEMLDDVWIKLNPDGIMSFFIIESKDIEGTITQDVMITLNRINTKTRTLEEVPYVICRQSVIDIFALLQDKTRYIAGMTMSVKTCPNEVNFSDFLRFEKMNHKVQVAVYMEDHQDDILRLINTHKFDTTLRNIKAKAHKMIAQGVQGYCETLYDLMRDNFFMFDFRDAYDITEIDMEKFDFEDDKTNKALTEFIISSKQEVPVKFYPMKFDRSVYLEELQRPYVLIAPMSYKYPLGDITVLCYDVSQTISFKDVVNKGLKPSDAKKEVMKQLGWQ